MIARLLLVVNALLFYELVYHTQANYKVYQKRPKKRSHQRKHLVGF